MDPKVRSAEIFGSLLVLAGRSCQAKDRQLSRSLGHSPDFVRYAKRQRKKGASLEEVFGIVAATGQPECVVFGKLFPQPTPADLLRLLRDADQQQTVPPPLLAHARRACDALRSKEVIPAEMPRASLRLRLGWIDELRFQDPAEGLRQVEDQIESLVIVMNCASKPDPSLVGELAFAVALWGDIQRSAGHAGLALVACPLALDLAEKSLDRWAQAHCLWLAAILAHDLGHSECGLPWLDEVSFLFGLEQKFSHLPQLLVTRGQLQLALGRKEPAAKSFRDALYCLPFSDHRWRNPALLQLAILCQEADRFQEALGHLVMLLEGHARRDAFQGEIQNRKAATQISLGQIPEAIATFGKSAQLLSEIGHQADAARALCDFSDQLLRQRQPERIGHLAFEVLNVWGRNRPSHRLVQWAEDFYALARLRPLAQADVDRLRYRLQELEAAPQRVRAT